MLPTTRNQSTCQYICPRLQSVAVFVTWKAARDNIYIYIHIGYKILSELDHLSVWKKMVASLDQTWGLFFHHLTSLAASPFSAWWSPNSTSWRRFPCFLIPTNDVVFSTTFWRCTNIYINMSPKDKFTRVFKKTWKFIQNSCSACFYSINFGGSSISAWQFFWKILAGGWLQPVFPD